MKKKNLLFNKKAVKKYIKSKGGKTHNDLLKGDALNNVIMEILNKVIMRAKENVRRQ